MDAKLKIAVKRIIKKCRKLEEGFDRRGKLLKKSLVWLEEAKKKISHQEQMIGNQNEAISNLQDKLNKVQLQLDIAKHGLKCARTVSNKILKRARQEEHIFQTKRTWLHIPTQLSFDLNNALYVHFSPSTGSYGLPKRKVK